MAEYPKFGRLVEANWFLREGRMAAIWKNLKTVKLALMNMSKREFMNIAEKINSVRDKLKDTQGQMRGTNISSTCLKKKRISHPN